MGTSVDWETQSRDMPSCWWSESCTWPQFSSSKVKVCDMGRYVSGEEADSWTDINFRHSGCRRSSIRRSRSVELTVRLG